MESLELFATNNGQGGIESGYFIGCRYQIVPEMFAFGLDLGIPSSTDQDWAVVPNVALTMGLTEVISFGIGADLGIDLNRNVRMGTVETPEDSSRIAINLNFGLERRNRYY
ncbi:MAG: hypothetical protein FWB85_03820 [Chitinispirillia bacterium]|nr:hypothetical protein [Chitinispirillia bacterium]MCL2241523.1 hypothetical protein [Chitinispirillia bacterium]